MRPSKSNLLVLCALIGICPASGLPLARADQRPNVVLIMCDDMGFSDVGCYGGEIQTPNIDRLAAEGLRFTQFYNCAKCTTTRASVVTGLHPRRGRGGLLDGCCNFFNPVRPDPPYKGGRVRTFGHNDRLLKEFPDDFYTTDAFSDHAADRTETNDLAQRYPERVKAMSDKWEAWAEQTGLKTKPKKNQTKPS